MKLAAEHVKSIAKDLASDYLTEQSVITLMRMGAAQVMHEVTMAVLGKKSINTDDLIGMFNEQKEALDALKIVEGE